MLQNITVTILNKNNLIISTHVAIWTCFVLIPYIFYSQPNSSGTPPSIASHFRIELVLSSIYLIIFYYFNTLILIPKFLYGKKWGIYLSIGLFSFVLFHTLPDAIAKLIGPKITIQDIKTARLRRYTNSISDTLSVEHNHHQGNWFPIRRKHFFPQSYIIFFLVFLIGIALTVIQKWLKLESIYKDIERERLNTELQFLKTQINPHFFFNTLNNIYSLAVVGSEQTAPSILKLSAIMRYIISDAKSNFVSVQSEVSFLNHFIQLQLTRVTDMVTLSFEQEGLDTNKCVAPLLFLPFVENAFKYGVSARQNTNIYFYLGYKDSFLTFISTNDIVKSENSIREGTSIGIENVKRRLQLLYPNCHKLNIVNNGNIFSVNLEITLK